jgi:hypothetical protein
LNEDESPSIAVVIAECGQLWPNVF